MRQVHVICLNKRIKNLKELVGAFEWLAIAHIKPGQLGKPDACYHTSGPNSENRVYRSASVCASLEECDDELSTEATKQPRCSQGIGTDTTSIQFGCRKKQMFSERQKCRLGGLKNQIVAEVGVQGFLEPSETAYSGKFMRRRRE